MIKSTFDFHTARFLNICFEALNPFLNTCNIVCFAHVMFAFHFSNILMILLQNISLGESFWESICFGALMYVNNKPLQLNVFISPLLFEIKKTVC